MRNIRIVVPCYHCPVQLQRVLRKILEKATLLKQLGVSDILVIDNSRDDHCAHVVKEFSSTIIALTYHHNEKNLGLGGSFKYSWQDSKRRGFSHLVFFHGDDQASVEDLINILELRDLSQIQWGNRFFSQAPLIGYSQWRNWGNFFLNCLASLIVNERVFDLGSGLNLFPMGAYSDRDIDALPNHIAFDIPLLVMGLRRKSLQWQNISWSTKDERSSISNFKVGLLVLTELLRSAVRDYVDKILVLCKDLKKYLEIHGFLNLFKYLCNEARRSGEDRAFHRTASGTLFKNSDRKLLKEIMRDFDRSLCFVDFGAGSGSAIQAAMNLDFKCGVGFEVNGPLAGRARKRLSKYGEKVKILEGDFSEAILSAPSLVFAYDPGAGFLVTLENVLRSKEARAAIYQNNIAHPQEVMTKDWGEFHVARKVLHGNQFFIFTRSNSA